MFNFCLVDVRQGIQCTRGIEDFILPIEIANIPLIANILFYLTL
jgi:hypothetical protein